MERFTEDVLVPPGLALKAHRHRQKRRMTGRVAVAAGTATVVAGSLAVAGAAGAFGSSSGAPVRTAYTAYVITHVERALAAPRIGNLVEADRTVFTPGSTLKPFPDALVGTAGGAGSGARWSAGYTLRWIYHGSIELSSFTASGQRVFDWAISPGHGTTAVIYGNDTWWTAAAQHGQGGSGSAPSSCLRGHEIALSGGAGNGWPGFIRSQLACGAYKVAGRQLVDGINTIKITGTSSGFTFWVDPANYLPVQADLGPRQTEFHWLAPTPAHLAHLKVGVPAGFKQVPPPALPAASTR
jgi:hypothetical protein